MITGWYNPLFTLNNQFFLLLLNWCTQIFSSYRRNMEKSNRFKSYDQARTSFGNSMPISKRHMRCKSIPPHATRAPRKKNDWQFSISWRHGSDCEIDIDLAGGQRGTTRSVRKHGNVMVGAKMGDILLGLPQDLDPTRIVCFNILRLVLTFNSYSLYNRIFCVVLVLRPPPC